VCVAWRRCEACGAAFVQGRGRPSKFCPAHRRGGGRYGGAHKKLVATTRDQAYGGPCCRCGRVLAYGQEIHLDHLDGGGPGDYLGWSHASCNIAAAGRGNRMRGGVNGRPVNGRPVTAPVPAIPPPVPDIRHSPDCRCGGTVTYEPGKFWTSKCW